MIKTAMWYQKKHEEARAIQFTGGAENANVIINWLLGIGFGARWSEAHDGHMFPDGQSYPDSEEKITIMTPESTMHAYPNDWIVLGDQLRNLLCVYSANNFERTYERMPKRP